MTVKLLKPYKGFEIEKSYEEKADGTIKKYDLFIQRMQMMKITLYLMQQRHYQS